MIYTYIYGHGRKPRHANPGKQWLPMFYLCSTCVLPVFSSVFPDPHIFAKKHPDPMFPSVFPYLGKQLLPLFYLCFTCVSFGVSSSTFYPCICLYPWPYKNLSEGEGSPTHIPKLEGRVYRVLPNRGFSSAISFFGRRHFTSFGRGRKIMRNQCAAQLPSAINIFGR